MKRSVRIAAYLGLWLPVSVWAQAPIEMWVTTDPGGGPGQATLQSGTNAIHVFASGNAGIDDFQFDPRPAAPGIEPGQETATLGDAFKGSGLSALALGAFDKFFGWSKFVGPSVQITGPTELLSFTVTVRPGFTGDDAALDLAGSDFGVQVDGTHYDAVLNGNAALRIPGPAADPGTGGGGDGGGGGATGGGGTPGDDGSSGAGTPDPGDPGAGDPGAPDPTGQDPGTGNPTPDPSVPDGASTPDTGSDPGSAAPSGSSSGSPDNGADLPAPMAPLGGGMCGAFGAIEMPALLLALGLLGRRRYDRMLGPGRRVR